MTWERRGPRQTFTSSTAWRKLRLVVIERDNGRCVLCGSTERIEVDHVDRLGPQLDVGNCRVLCHQCHQSKTAKEAAASRWKYRATRATPKHPGLL